MASQSNQVGKHFGLFLCRALHHNII